MSKNCIRCVKNQRTGLDLLCDECRAAAQGDSFAGDDNVGPGGDADAPISPRRYDDDPVEDDGTEGPCLAAIVVGLAAQITVLSPQGIAELHAAVDELSNVTSELSFHQARGRLGLALTRRVTAANPT